MATVFALLLCYGVSLQTALAALRERRWGRRLHSLVWTSGSFTLGSLFLALYFYMDDAESSSHVLAIAGKWLTIAALAMAAIGFVLWLYYMVARHRAAQQGATAHHKVSLRKRLHYAYELAQPDWKKLSAPEYRFEDEKEVARSTTIIGFGVTALAFPAIVILLSASILMNIRGSVTSDFASRTLGYYTLLVATCWTIVFLATLAFLAIQQVLRDQGKQLSPGAVVLSVGTWAGFGAAGGVFVGALIPAVVIIIPKGPFESLDVTLLDTISPELLLNISASGAVIGFLAGEVASLIDFAEGEQNLFVKSVIPPAIFAIVATILGALGLRPGAISAHLSGQYEKDVLKGSTHIADPFTTGLHTDLDSSDGWASLIVAFDKHGWNHVVDFHVYFVATWVIALLVIIFGFTFRLHHREIELVTMELKETKKSGAQSAPPQNDPESTKGKHDAKSVPPQ